LIDRDMGGGKEKHSHSILGLAKRVAERRANDRKSRQQKRGVRLPSSAKERGKTRLFRGSGRPVRGPYAEVGGGALEGLTGRRQKPDWALKRGNTGTSPIGAANETPAPEMDRCQLKRKAQGSPTSKQQLREEGGCKAREGGPPSEELRRKSVPFVRGSIKDRC